MFASIVGSHDHKTAADWITKQKSTLPVRELHRIPKPILVRIRKNQLPRLASIRRLIQPRQIARSARHHNRRIRVEPLNPAKIQLFRARRNCAPLPQITAVFRPQNRAIRSARPRNATAHIVDAPQIRRRPRVQNLPLRAKRRARQTNGANGKRENPITATHTEQCRSEQGSRIVATAELFFPSKRKSLHPKPPSFAD